MYNIWIYLQNLSFPYYKSPKKGPKYAKFSAISTVISHAPRYLLEIVAFGGIMVIVIYLISKGEIPKPGSYRGRLNSEPENNRKTLMDVKNA